MCYTPTCECIDNDLNCKTYMNWSISEWTLSFILSRFHLFILLSPLFLQDLSFFFLFNASKNLRACQYFHQFLCFCLFLFFALESSQNLERVPQNLLPVVRLQAHMVQNVPTLLFPYSVCFMGILFQWYLWVLLLLSLY